MPKVSTLENAALKLLLGGTRMREAQQQARPWLERLGLGDRLAHTPEELSGGERQRVAIARALAGEPRLILADEPTGNLDSARSIETVELLADIAHEQAAAVVLVTHDSEAARLADRRYVLRDGQLLSRRAGDRRVTAVNPPRLSPDRRQRRGEHCESPARRERCARTRCCTSTADACARTPSRSCSPASASRSRSRSSWPPPSPSAASPAPPARWCGRSSDNASLQLRAQNGEGFSEGDAGARRSDPRRQAGGAAVGADVRPSARRMDVT